MTGSGCRRQPGMRGSFFHNVPQEETLLEAFQPYGVIQHIKLLRDKGGA